MRRSRVRRNGRRGGALMEMALLMPWVFLIFIGLLDWGFYAYSLISMQSAIRTAVLYTSTSVTLAANTTANTTAVCQLVVKELQDVPNVGSTNDCSSNPLVSTAPEMGPDGNQASRVTVTYQSVSMIPLPGLLTKQFTITRSGLMRIRSTT